ncbi:hypothetical protein FACS189421_12990 [Bacteroidia bacterium]|nr:hypothetical protein FACS189421_12990 [Bacteroidia bacterium]
MKIIGKNILMRSKVENIYVKEYLSAVYNLPGYKGGPIRPDKSGKLYSFWGEFILQYPSLKKLISDLHIQIQYGEHIVPLIRSFNIGIGFTARLDFDIEKIKYGDTRIEDLIQENRAGLPWHTISDKTTGIPLLQSNQIHGIKLYESENNAHPEYENLKKIFNLTALSEPDEVSVSWKNNRDFIVQVFSNVIYIMGTAEQAAQAKESQKSFQEYMGETIALDEYSAIDIYNISQGRRELRNTLNILTKNYQTI